MKTENGKRKTKNDNKLKATRKKLKQQRMEATSNDGPFQN